MARRADADNHLARRRGVLRHYPRPVWRDRLFWLVAVMSGLTTAAFVAVILVITGVPDTPVGWLRPVLLGLVVLLLAFRLLGAGVTTSRHFQRGLGEGSAPRPNDLEAKGRAAGAVVGRAVRAARVPSATTTRSTPRPEPTPEATPSASAPQPDVTTTTDPVGGREAQIDERSAVTPEPVSRDPEPEPIDPEPLPMEPEPVPVPTAGAEPVVTPTDPTPSPKPKVTADAAARSIGSMVGRRMAERRKKG